MTEEKAPPPKKKGRPHKSFEHPRKDIAEQIELLSGCGISIDAIAARLQIGRQTIYNHYKHEVETGRTHVDSVVAMQWFKSVARGQPWAIERGLDRMGFRKEIGLSGPNGGPIQVEIVRFGDGPEDKTPT